MIKPLEQHLTPDKVAERLGVTARTVRRWINTGALYPVYKPARALLVPESAVVRFLERHKHNLELVES